MRITRVLVVDDHAIVRAGLCTMLKALPEMELAGEAASGQEAIALIPRLQPDLVIMDLLMPLMDGIEATAAIHRSWPDLPVLILTSCADADSVLRAIKAGARGYLVKDSPIAELTTALRMLASGRPYLHPAAQQYLVAATMQPARTTTALTPREQEVFALLGAGLSNRQIGDQLSMTEKTASVHVSNILRKLDLSSRTQAALHLHQARI